MIYIHNYFTICSRLNVNRHTRSLWIIRANRCFSKLWPENERPLLASNQSTFYSRKAYSLRTCPNDGAVCHLEDLIRRQCFTTVPLHSRLWLHKVEGKKRQHSLGHVSHFWLCLFWIWVGHQSEQALSAYCCDLWSGSYPKLFHRHFTFSGDP